MKPITKLKVVKFQYLMIMFRTIYILLILLFTLTQCTNVKKEQKDDLHELPTRFDIKRGVNISHWLSQSKRRGSEREEFFTEDDVEFIAGIGYDHLRIPIDEEQMWNESGEKEIEAFKLLHSAIGWAFNQNLKVIVDLHILRSHHFNADEKPLWTDSGAQDRFFQCWRDLSDELSKYSTDKLAYELMNEPVADDPEDWNNLVARAAGIVRENEPKRFIVIGSNRWQSVETFDDLKVPEDDLYIILSFHFYEPFLLTHHQASWTSIGDYAGPVKYPGLLVDSADIAGIADESLKEQVRSRNGVYNKDTLEKMMLKPIQKAKELNLQLYCGEWGCLPTVSRKSFLHWYGDMHDIMEKHNITWTNWDYKGGFGVVDRKLDDSPITDLIEVLLK